MMSDEKKKTPRCILCNKLFGMNVHPDDIAVGICLSCTVLAARAEKATEDISDGLKKYYADQAKGIPRLEHRMIDGECDACNQLVAKMDEEP